MTTISASTTLRFCKPLFFILDTMASIARFATILGRRYPLVVCLIKKYCNGVRPLPEPPNSNGWFPRLGSLERYHAPLTTSISDCIVPRSFSARSYGNALQAVCLRTYASWTSFNGGKLHDGKYLSENSAVAVTAPYKYWHEMQSKIMQQLSNNYARWRNCKAAESSNCNRLAKCCENDRTNNALTRLTRYIYILRE
ncbi:hypothetical protein ALC57_04761 [Trachymyrmex cornetzi]|uniref:Uncharacterized protein n=1 Tax=Trachymyrmex cornetzi TaxID=471704 RepID=A0A195ECN8_9HYME|nr:hypothetical protein ALC57_04761 [Trachymyrmex cornetzi]